MNIRLDGAAFREDGNAFHALTARYLKPFWVCASLHFGRWKSPVSVALVLLDDTSDRLVNMSRSTSGQR